MKSLVTLSRWTASALLVTAAACADNITEGNALSDLSQPPASTSAASSKTPTLEVKSRWWDSRVYPVGPVTGPNQAWYRVDIDGTDFPAGVRWEATVFSVLDDGYILVSGPSGGVNPPDGTFRMNYVTDCVSHVRDVYAEVTSGGRTTVSNHITPGC